MNLCNGKNIPVPILFNCWKHHKDFVKEMIEKLVDDNQYEFDQIKENLLRIGESQVDFYFGNLSPEKISTFIKKDLEEKKLLGKVAFIKWISKAENNYRMISLPDNSKWTIRLGTDETRYVHIHPGRHVTNTIRIRSLTLKTAILFCSIKKLNAVEKDDLFIINDLRKKYLNVPPIKSFNKTQGLIKVIELLS
jgi:hypothetical protein